MKPLIGEHDCTLDAKGRFLMPAGLRKQLPEDQQSSFIMNRGIDQCLVLYPETVWERELERIQSRNQYLKENRAFTRMFLNGATPISLDGNARVLVPKRLIEHAKLGKKIVLIAQIDKIEIWDPETYNKWLEESEVDFESLAEKVMGGGQE